MQPLPRGQEAQDWLDALVARLRPLREGQVADYIPELAHVDQDALAVAMAGVDGQVLAAGDAQVRFSIQSMSKPFVYALALRELGPQAVHQRVGVEPTGEAFNSIVELEEDHLPYNPMINSGAISISALLHHHDREGAWDRMQAFLSACMGAPAQASADIQASELSASHRNRAIAHLLRHYGVIGDDIDGALQLYTRQCAVLAGVRELALMAATLANGGVHPVTRERVLAAGHVRDVLALMATCGMYDSSGAWAYQVGLPAKSGVSGGILAVVPGRAGLAVYSPRLDAHGHSVRGMAAFRAWSRDWGLSLYTPAA